jgi:hypothetical protein
MLDKFYHIMLNYWIKRLYQFENTKWGLIGNFNWKKDIQCPKGTVYKDKQCSIKSLLLLRRFIVLSTRGTDSNTTPGMMVLYFVKRTSFECATTRISYMGSPRWIIKEQSRDRGFHMNRPTGDTWIDSYEP